MLNRFLIVLVLVPLAIILIALAVANRGAVPFTLDPFNPGNPALTVDLPLFALLFIALAIGLIVGSVTTWAKQQRYRKLAREREREAKALREAAPKPDRPGTALARPGA